MKKKQLNKAFLFILLFLYIFSRFVAYLYEKTLLTMETSELIEKLSNIEMERFAIIFFLLSAIVLAISKRCISCFVCLVVINIFAVNVFSPYYFLFLPIVLIMFIFKYFYPKILNSSTRSLHKKALFISIFGTLLVTFIAFAFSFSDFKMLYIKERYSESSNNYIYGTAELTNVSYYYFAFILLFCVFIVYQCVEQIILNKKQKIDFSDWVSLFTRNGIFYLFCILFAVFSATFALNTKSDILVRAVLEAWLIFSVFLAYFGDVIMLKIYSPIINLFKFDTD